MIADGGGVIFTLIEGFGILIDACSRQRWCLLECSLRHFYAGFHTDMHGEVFRWPGTALASAIAFSNACCVEVLGGYIYCGWATDRAAWGALVWLRIQDV